ncbi:AsmA-like protein [Cecembia rubra]|uniref:AsmA-like protein n=2 Tax=Cecembia rubra TaxID=1485585 RepID=A0A2P8E2Y8_9BACT|nr:AsmA-like protein [Cecembia rubra]
MSRALAVCVGNFKCLMKVWIKKVIIALFALPFFLIGLTAAVFALKQEAITQKAIDAANGQFLGKLTVENSRISVLSDFPYISIDLQGVAFYENKDKNTRPFYRAGDLYVGFNIWDILRGNYKVKSIRISEGHVDVVKYPNGDINLLLAKGIQSKKSEQEEIMEFDLAKLKINNFSISYEDLSDTMSYRIHLDNWKSSIRKRDGNFEFDLDGKLVFDLLRKGLPTFFFNKHIRLDLDLIYDLEKQILNLKPSSVMLGEALFEAKGKVDVLEEGIDLDLKLDGQKPDFNIIAAFLPDLVSQALKEYHNQGEVFFKGSVKGLIAEGHSPSMNFEFGCENAFFLRAENNRKVDDLRFYGFFTNGEEKSLKTSELRIQNFNARPDQGIFQGDLIIRNFEDPYVKVKLNADIDLGFVREFFRLDAFEGMSGQVLLSMDFDELVEIDASTADLARLKQSVQSELSLRDLNFSLKGYPYPVQEVNAYAMMQAGKITLRRLNFKIKDSDIELKGSLSDFPALFHRFSKPIDLNIEAKSKLLDLGQLLDNGNTEEKIHDLTLRFGFTAQADELFDFAYLPKGQFRIEDFHAKLENYPHTFHDFDVEVYVGEKELDVRKFKGEINDSDFLLKFKVQNYPKWFKDEREGASSIRGVFQSNKLKISDLMTYNGVDYLPESWRDEKISSLNFQGKLDLYFNDGLQSADFILEQLTGRMQMHPLKLEHFRGKVNWDKGYLSIKDFGGKMGASEFAFDLGLNMRDSVKTRNDYFHLRAAALDLDALLGFKGFEEDTNHAEAFNIFKIPFREMEFSADIKRLNYHFNWLEDIRAKARTNSNHFLHLDTLSLRVAKGSLGMKGYFNGSNPDEIYLHAALHAEKLDLDKLLFKLEHSGKDIMINDNLKGSISGNIEGRFLVYPDLTPIIDKSEAKLALTVYDGTLLNFAPFSALSDYFSDRNLNRVRFDTLSNTFELKEGALIIPRMNINSSLGFLEISGRQGLDMDMNYQIRIPWSLVTQVGARALFGGRSREEVDPDQEDAIIFRDQNRRVRFLNINMQGRPDNYRVSLGRR